ncbi:sensor histidine kinase [Legionella impletisoli]|uniref:histidine kinase n=1 Tax=Legionella impletisoli TaxID=343510 RepID=A0A917JVD5_9GAMM|nr:HAMP domain-containing sensor histidine kinase [Legionella impletisoli]GGI87810.1 hypothetical protein GCM10007966_15690 [Legionella impletisoli]
MKFSIFTKILMAFLIISVVFIVLFFKYMKSVELDIVVNSEKVIAEGFLSDLEKEISSTSPSQWGSILSKIKDKGVEILPIDKINLTQTQKANLNSGKVVVLTEKDYQFLNLVIASKTAYKKIGNTKFLLAYYYSKIEKIITQYMAPALNQIAKDFLSKPRSSWSEESKRLEKIYGFPIHVYPTTNQELPINVVQSLSKNNVAFETNENTSQIGIIYHAFAGGVLKIGPINYLSITARISDVIGYFVMAFFVFCSLLITFLSLLFIRNMKKIYQITENFSHGRFDFHQKISTTSVLFGVYANIVRMGQQIKDMIESHKQMYRFVAHETRTPLSTINLAADSIQRKNPEDEFIKKQLDSIRKDVKDVNQIVSTYLIYSKMHSANFILKRIDTDIISWLRKLIEPYKASNLEMDFQSNKLSSLNAYIDKGVFKHAITNLITNALKFAEHHVSLSVEQNKSQILIHVDDDGSGLPSDTQDDIFSEYTTAEDRNAGNKHIGLGLAIVKKVVALHGGKVSATQSPILKGARFTISLLRSYLD